MSNLAISTAFWWNRATEAFSSDFHSFTISPIVLPRSDVKTCCFSAAGFGSSVLGAVAPNIGLGVSFVSDGFAVNVVVVLGLVSDAGAPNDGTVGLVSEGLDTGAPNDGTAGLVSAGLVAGALKDGTAGFVSTVLVAGAPNDTLSAGFVSVDVVTGPNENPDAVEAAGFEDTVVDDPNENPPDAGSAGFEAEGAPTDTVSVGLTGLETAGAPNANPDAGLDADSEGLAVAGNPNPVPELVPNPDPAVAGFASAAAAGAPKLNPEAGLVAAAVFPKDCPAAPKLNPEDEGADPEVVGAAEPNPKVGLLAPAPKANPVLGVGVAPNAGVPSAEILRGLCAGVPGTFG